MLVIAAQPHHSDVSAFDVSEASSTTMTRLTAAKQKIDREDEMSPAPQVVTTYAVTTRVDSGDARAVPDVVVLQGCGQRSVHDRVDHHCRDGQPECQERRERLSSSWLELS